MVGVESTDAFQGLNLGIGLDILTMESGFLNVELRWNNEWEGFILRVGAVQRLGAARRPVGARRR